MRTVPKQETCIRVPTEILSVAQKTAVLGSLSDHLLPKYQLADPHFLQWVVLQSSSHFHIEYSDKMLAK